MQKILLTLLTGCVFGGLAFCGETGESFDRQTLRNLIDRDDVTGLQALVSKIEAQGPKLEGFASYEQINTLCQELGASKKRDKLRSAILLQCGRMLILKSDLSINEDPSVLYKNQSDVAELLLSFVTKSSDSTDVKEWLDVRGNVMRLVMSFTHKASKNFIPDYKPQEYSTAVVPSLGSNEPFDPTLTAGCDPKLIKDPTARAAYETAIKENRERGWKNDEQHYLSIIKSRVFPRIENGIILVYSKAQTDYNELDEYLQSGAFGPEDRLRIINSVERKSGKAAPSNLLNQLKAAVEKKK